jgi:hypothetical protein
MVITVPGVLFVPDCPSHLICPRQLLATSTHPGAGIHITETCLQMWFHNNFFTIPYDTGTQLPILYTTSGITSYINYCISRQLNHLPQTSCLLAHADPATNVTLEVPGTLTKAQQLKLHWYNWLNHINFDQLTQWMRQGLIKADPATINCPNPVCAACHYGKARRCPHSSATGVIDKHHLAPGDGVSTDQLEARHPGIVPTNKGSPTSATYKYCNFWVDHFS